MDEMSPFTQLFSYREENCGARDHKSWIIACTGADDH